MSVSDHGVAGCTGACRNVNTGRHWSGLTAVDAFLRSTLASCSWLGGVEGFLPRTDELRLRFDVFSSIQDLQAVIVRYFLSAQITYSPLLEQPTHTRPSTPAGVEATQCRILPANAPAPAHSQ